MPGLPNVPAEVGSRGPARQQFDLNTPHDVAPARRLYRTKVSKSAAAKVEAASADNPCTRKGWLHKKGGKLGTKGWDKRWFVLVDDKLSYFKNPGDAKPKGVIEIRDISEVCSPAPR